MGLIGNVLHFSLNEILNLTLEDVNFWAKQAVEIQKTLRIQSGEQQERTT